MPRITFLQDDGTRILLEVQNGKNLMQAATGAGIEGIIGDCGGNLACATCHVFVDEDFLGVLPEPTQYERDMLDFTATPTKTNSRLCCQIIGTDALDGLLVTIPEAQE